MARAGGVNGFMVRTRVAVTVCVGLLLSVTVTAILLDPVVVGVPDKTPEELRVSGEGTPVALKVYGAVPPLAAIVVEYAVPELAAGSVVVLIDN